MTTISLSSLENVILSSVGNKLPEADLTPGSHPFEFIVHVKGTATRGEDTEKTPTSRALTLETLALFIHRMGIQREKALEVLTRVLTENIEMDKDQKAALMEQTGVAEAKVRLDAEMKKLPKTPVKGRLSVTLEKVVSLDLENAAPVAAEGEAAAG